MMVNENPMHLEDVVLMISMYIFLLLDIRLGKLLLEIQLGH